MAFNVADILGTTLVEGIAKIISLFKVDPTLALEKQIELQELQINIASQLQNKIQDAINEQIAVNEKEATSTSLFVAGWRPFIGWVCGVGLASQFIVGPFFTWIATLTKHPTPFPTLDLGTLMTLLFGMLGLGGMRTFEKINSAPGSEKLH